jgi:hypothetical protein
MHAHHPNVRIDLRSLPENSLPAKALVFEESPGYIFLPRCEEEPRPLDNNEAEALRIYWHEQGWPGLDNWNDSVCRWAKLQLPNGQKAWSVWFKKGSVASLCCTSCVEVICTTFISSQWLTAPATQITHNGGMRIADVQFYFCMRFGGTRHPLAMVHLFSLPDQEVLQDSSETVYLCDVLPGSEGLCVVHVSAIHSIVCMFPEPQVSNTGQITHTGKLALMQHPHIGMA